MILLALALQAAAPASAPQAAPTPVCTATDKNLPAALAGWLSPGAGLSPGHAVIAPAVDMKTVKMVGVPGPAKPGNVAAISFTIATAGIYRIALDQGGWIDVIPEASQFGPPPAAPLKSTTHSHGPDCSTIHKIVAFQLAPGTYKLWLSGLKPGMVKAMLIAG